MKEHDPQKFERAKAQVEAVSRKMGTNDGPRDFYFESMQGEDYINTAWEVGKIREVVAERTLPNLETHSQLSEGRQMLKEIAEMVEKGNLTEDVLAQAKQQVEREKSSIIPQSEKPFKTALAPRRRERKARIFRESTERPTLQPQTEQPVFDEEEKALKVNQQSYELSRSELIVVESFFDRLGEAIPSGQLSQRLKEAGLSGHVGRVIWGLEKKVGQRLFEREGGGLNSKWSSNITQQDAITPGKTEETPFSKIESYSQDKHKGAAQTSEITFPSGQTVEIQGKLKATTLEQLIDSFNNNQPGNNDELVQKLYGEVTLATRRRLKDIVNLLRPDLPLRWQITTHEGNYRLAHIEDIDEEVVQSTPSDAGQVEPAGPVSPTPEEDFVPISTEEGTTEGVATPHAPGPEEFIEVPYVPSAEEQRTQEETKLVGVVIDQISTRTRIYFEDIHREMREELQSSRRIRSNSGGHREVIPYTAPELIEKFFSGFRKIREEAKFPLTKDKWDEQDQLLWGKLQDFIDKSCQGNIELFQQRIREEIRRAQREFYRTYRKGNGNR